MTTDRVWLGVVVAVHAAGVDEWGEGRIRATRVHGGANNALYRVEVDDQVYACKLCVVDERRRAMREFGSLRLLQAAGLDIAPEPVWLDESCALLPYPAVAYRWLPGSSIGPALTQLHLASLLDTFLRLHSLQPGDFAGFDLPDRILVTRWPFLILRWLWSAHNGPDRLRLTQPAADVTELQGRLLGFIERAERQFNHG